MILKVGALLLLILTHLLGGKLRFLQGLSRSKWLSIAGGSSVSYIFLHVLPELQHYQSNISSITGIDFIDQRFYVIALLGLLILYGIERAAKLAMPSP